VIMRLIYVDDSGASTTKTAVFGWVEVDEADWRPVLRSWLDWRHELDRSIGITVEYELHSTKFVGSRGHPTGTVWDRNLGERISVMRSALARISSIPGLAFGAVYACAATTRDYRQLKARCYLDLVRSFDRRLAGDADRGIVEMDGDGTDPTYRRAHRELKLSSRWLIEDPHFHPGHHSQWVQMADIVAYTAYMHLARLPRKEATWSWYEDYLSNAVTGPVPLRLDAPENG
jgi:hypothetical protein